MRGDIIPDIHTVSRYCPYSKLSEAGRPTPPAFELRESDLREGHPHLSVNWLEYFGAQPRNEQLRIIRSILAGKMKVGSKARLALMQISKIHEKVQEIERSVRVLHWPDVAAHDESHAGIFDVETDPDVIAQALSRVVCEMVSAKDNATY
jgi:hypothetical protein